MTNIRRERILWLALRICAADDWMVYDEATGTFALHPALMQRMEEASKQAAVTTSKREAQLQAGPTGHVITPEAIVEVSRSAIVKASEKLDPDITAFVVDTNLLLSQLGRSTWLLGRDGQSSSRILVCVDAQSPWCCTKLAMQSSPNSQGLKTTFASGARSRLKSAMIAINKAIADRANTRIITAKGNDVTKTVYFKEKVERDENEIRNTDDIIIRTTRHQVLSRRQAFAHRVIGYAAQPAILLTEDTNMRVKANASGVPAISTTLLKKFLAQLRPKRSSPRRPEKKPTGPIVPRIKSEHGGDDDHPMLDVPDIRDTKSMNNPPAIESR